MNYDEWNKDFWNLPSSVFPNFFQEKEKHILIHFKNDSSWEFFLCRSCWLADAISSGVSGSFWFLSIPIIYTIQTFTRVAKTFEQLDWSRIGGLLNFVKMLKGWWVRVLTTVVILEVIRGSTPVSCQHLTVSFCLSFNWWFTFSLV